MGSNRFAVLILVRRLLCLGLFSPTYTIYFKRHHPRHTEWSLHSDVVPLRACWPLPFDSNLAYIYRSCRSDACEILCDTVDFGCSHHTIFRLVYHFQLNNNVFALTGYIGFFVLGTYLSTVQMRRSTLSIFIILGIVLTALGTYVLAATVGGTEMYFFQEYFSPTIILTAVMVFLLLLTIQPPSVQREISPSKVNRLIKVISENTLGIFFIHVMVIESIQRGYFGFAINRTTINPIIEVPLLTAITLFGSLAIILLLKKIPYMKKLIGCQL
jgi:hypothetical protein